MKGVGRQICRSRVRRVIGGENLDQFARELKGVEKDGCVPCMSVVCSFLGLPSSINSLEILKTQLNAMGRRQKKIKENQKRSGGAARRRQPEAPSKRTLK